MKKAVCLLMVLTLMLLLVPKGSFVYAEEASVAVQAADDADESEEYSVYTNENDDGEEASYSDEEIEALSLEEVEKLGLEDKDIPEAVDDGEENYGITYYGRNTYVSIGSNTKVKINSITQHYPCKSALPDGYDSSAMYLISYTYVQTSCGYTEVDPYAFDVTDDRGDYTRRYYGCSHTRSARKLYSQGSSCTASYVVYSNHVTGTLNFELTMYFHTIGKSDYKKYVRYFRVPVGNNSYSLLSGIDINKNAIILRPGENEKLDYTLYPSYASSKAHTYYFSNKYVATVDSYGYVSAKAPGTCTVNIKADKTFNNMNVSGTVQVYVLKDSEDGMFRMYNKNSGEHFYTANRSERYNLEMAGWKFEGLGWIAPKKSDTPVYRLYNPNAGDHHYTTSAGEKDSLVRAGWKYEGIGWYSASKNGKPLYRLYNPNAKAGAHHYTMDASEKNRLVSAGWKYEGVAWFGMQ